MRPTLRQLTQLSLAALFVLLSADAQLLDKAFARSATLDAFADELWSPESQLQASDPTDYQLEPDDDFDTTDQGDVALEAHGERWQSWTLSSSIVGVERPPTIHSRPRSCHTPRAPPLFCSLV